jgi:hypothetical protein
VGFVVVFAAASVALQGSPLLVLGVGVLDGIRREDWALRLICQLARSPGRGSLPGLSGGAVT